MNTLTTSVQEHYDTLLAGNYLWMAGGMKANIDAARTFLKDHSLISGTGGIALDLGAGCGFRAIPLADAGYRVTAVDISQEMLAILKSHAKGAAIRCIPGDILNIASWRGLAPELILCTGDTLTHLPNTGAVWELIKACGRELAPDTRMVISCRNYSFQPAGSSVIIPVRREDNRIFICRLDFWESNVMVSDFLYTRQDGCWRRACGTYPKLRISPEWLVNILTTSGFSVDKQDSSSDGITIVARRNP
jgi:SAM-dependent methyltransferase